MVAVLVPDGPTRTTVRFPRPAPVLRVAPVAPAPARPARQPAAVYRRRRVAVIGVAMFALVGGWLAVGALIGGGSPPALGPSRTIAAHSVVVQPGDTLWSIAMSSGVRGDIRPLVDELSAEVHGQPLQPGEVLSLP